MEMCQVKCMRNAWVGLNVEQGIEIFWSPSKLRNFMSLLVYKMGYFSRVSFYHFSNYIDNIFFFKIHFLHVKENVLRHFMPSMI